jgi:hypothetical protein
MIFFQVNKKLKRLQGRSSEHFLNSAVDCHLRMSTNMQASKTLKSVHPWG